MKKRTSVNAPRNSDFDPKKLLPVMVDAALAGGKILRKYWIKSENARRRIAREASTSARAEKPERDALHLSIQEKSGNAGLVTVADFESERACVRLLRKAFSESEFGFLTEEGTTLPRTTAKTSAKSTAKSTAKLPAETGPSRRWILDPLDGTTNFVHGFPMFCVSLGAEVDGEVVAGVIYHPLLDDLYTATRGGRALLNGGAIHVSSTSNLTGSLLSTGFTTRKHQHLSDEMDAFEAVSKKARAVRRPGSAALDLAYVARGVFDGFWERRLSPWDVAAGGLLVEAAGGKVTDFTGRPFQVDQPSVLATNGRLHAAVLPLLKE